MVDNLDRRQVEGAAEHSNIEVADPLFEEEVINNSSKEAHYRLEEQEALNLPKLKAIQVLYH